MTPLAAMMDRAEVLFTGRSPKWPALRRTWLAWHPTCAACGGKKNCVPHHVRPVHTFPELELDAKNLLTLCESPARNCHLAIGHSLLWTSYNPFAVSDAADFLARVRARP
jgi:hypothetical protein